MAAAAIAGTRGALGTLHLVVEGNRSPVVGMLAWDSFPAGWVVGGTLPAAAAGGMRPVVVVDNLPGTPVGVAGKREQKAALHMGVEVHS